jgi:hypothetical protein
VNANRNRKEDVVLKEYELGNVASLKLTAEGRVLAGSLVLWGLLSIIGIGLLDLDAFPAMAGSVLAVVLHWISELVHQLGHAWAARRTGHPMTGIHFGKMLLLGTSIYPPDEGALPAKVHIRRALGGPASSLLFSLVAGLAVFALRSTEGVLWWVGLFFFVENLGLFTVGAFLPLGFTDGSTLLEWWLQRKDAG